jgi:AcrR family transcriptional regulator
MNKPAKKRSAKTMTEARIVEAAVQLFAQGGYKGTSTRDIARLAKVNEVTLFRYFPHKINLFSAAAESRFSRICMGRDLQQKLATTASLQATVPLLAEFLLENLFRRADVLRMIFVAGFEVPGADRMVREYLGPFFDTIYSYFERCAAKGWIRDIEPAVAALSLAGVMNAHQNFYRVFTEQELDWDIEKSIPVYSDFLLGALGHRPSRGPVPSES